MSYFPWTCSRDRSYIIYQFTQNKEVCQKLGWRVPLSIWMPFSQGSSSNSTDKCQKKTCFILPFFVICLYLSMLLQNPWNKSSQKTSKENHKQLPVDVLIPLHSAKFLPLTQIDHLWRSSDRCTRPALSPYHSEDFLWAMYSGGWVQILSIR